MTGSRLLVLPLVALGLAACAADPSGQVLGRYSAAGPDGVAPLAILPAGTGEVLALRQSRFANGLRQEIVLDGPRRMVGENRITIEALTTARSGGAEGGDLILVPPSDADVAAALAREMPGISMQLAATPLRTQAGDMGFATGVSGRLACIYAWQYRAPAHPLSLIEGATDTGRLPVSIRLRLCREEPLTALLARVSGLRLMGAGPAPAPALGDGDPLAAALTNSSRASLDMRVDGDAAPVARPRIAAHRARAVRQRPAAPRPAAHHGPSYPHPVGAAVPLPSDVASGANPAPLVPVAGAERPAMAAPTEPMPMPR